MRTIVVSGLATALSIALCAPVASQTPATGENVVATHYAAEHGVSVEEAQRRLATLSDIAAVEKALADRFPNQFGGLFVVHEPNFRVVVKMTGAGEGLLQQVTQDPLYVVEKAERPVKMMLQLQDRIVAALVVANVGFETNVNVWTGEIEVDVIDAEGARKALGQLLEANAFVKLRKVAALPQNTAAIYGGRAATGSTQGCTTGFSVTNGVISGFLTAGHCDNTLTVSGYSFSLKEQVYQNSTQFGHDMQWMSNSSHTFPNEIYRGSSTREVITNVYDPINMPLDWSLCAFGVTTNALKCGKLKSKYTKTTDNNGIVGYFFRAATDDGSYFVQEGDSGGPVFGANTAYGIIKGKGGTTYPRDMYFMSIADIDVMGIRVKTSP